jgi:ribonuclease HII
MASAVTLTWEEHLYETDGGPVAGLDEAGRGPLAGPVVACAVILPRNIVIEGVNDSKKLSPKRRETLARVIKDAALAWAVGVIDAETIDRVNILRATYMAMAQAVGTLAVKPGSLLIDGLHPPFPPLVLSDYPSMYIPHGDTISHTIAAASIIAKVTRDAFMDVLHEQYPMYGFNRHKGYGTAEHRAAIKQYGPCPQHRVSFSVKEKLI